MKIVLKCSHCGKEFERERKYYNHSLKLGWDIFCSQECQRLGKIKEVLEKCATCGKEVKISPSRKRKSKTGNIYCSRHCSASNNNKLFKKWKNHPNYKEGKSRYRYLKINSVENPKCEKCGFDNVIALEIHHKDKNRNNNKLENLEILCCNCHTIEHFKERHENVVYR